MVVVVDDDEPTEALAAGQGGGLVTDALGQAAITGDDVDVVVAQLGPEAGSEVAFGHGHADPVGQTLAERARGDLDAGGVTGLGVPRRGRVPLAELAQVLEFETLAGQVEHRVVQDRGVASGEDETIAVRPGRIGGVVGQDPGEQHMGQRCQGHRGSLVARPGGVRPVHGQATDHVDALLLQLRRNRRGVERSVVSGDFGHGSFPWLGRPGLAGRRALPARSTRSRRSSWRPIEAHSANLASRTPGTGTTAESMTLTYSTGGSRV